MLQILQHKIWPRHLNLGPLMARQQPNHIAVCGFTSTDARGCIFDHEDSSVFGNIEQGAGEEVACEGEYDDVLLLQGGGYSIRTYRTLVEANDRELGVRESAFTFRIRLPLRNAVCGHEHFRCRKPHNLSPNDKLLPECPRQYGKQTLFN